MKGRLKAFKKKIKELGMNKKERNFKKEGGKISGMVSRPDQTTLKLFTKKKKKKKNCTQLLLAV